MSINFYQYRSQSGWDYSEWNDGSFQDFINKQDPEFTFQPVSIVHVKVYNPINNLSTSKATGTDKISAN